MTTEIFIMSTPGNKGVVIFDCPNMDTKNCQADEKSRARKKTQVTLMKKKVTIAG